MRCLSLEQLIAALIIITIVSMLFGLFKLGSFVNTILILWYLVGYIVPCDGLAFPSMYTGTPQAIPVVPVQTTEL